MKVNFGDFSHAKIYFHDLHLTKNVSGGVIHAQKSTQFSKYNLVNFYKLNMHI